MEHRVYKGTGVGFLSCNSAVAVNRGAIQYYWDGPRNDMGINGIPFIAVYGSSRLYKSLDFDLTNALGFEPVPAGRRYAQSSYEEHAEQVAIRFVREAANGSFWCDSDENFHIYVDFTPCDTCSEWFSRQPEKFVFHYSAELKQKNEFITARKAALRLMRRQAQQAARGGQTYHPGADDDDPMDLSC